MRIFISLFSFFLVLSMTSISSHASGEDEKFSYTSQELFAQSRSQNIHDSLIIITTKEGVQKITSEKEKLLSAILLESGYKITDFKDELGQPLEDKELGTIPLFLFKIDYTGTSERFEIAPNVIEVKTKGLPVGEKEIKDEGTPGIGIQTTIIEEDLSTNSSVNSKASTSGTTNTKETITVVKQPEPKVILVGAPWSEMVNYTPPITKYCLNGTKVPDSVHDGIKKIHNDVCAKWPEIKTYHTLRDSCTHGCDHKDGYALDIMVEGELGTEIANFLLENYKEYKIDYIIWEQKIWGWYNPIWRQMEDRGGKTANHFDHVHISLNLKD